MRLRLCYSIGGKVKMKGRQEYGQIPELHQQLERLERHWSNKLLLCESNRYPLAPVDLKESGLVIEGEYVFQNAAFGRFVSSKMREELSFLDKKLLCLNNPVIEIFGAGLARDLGWIRTAVSLGCKVNIRDVSRVAIEYASRAFTDLVSRDSVRFIEGEIETTLKSEPIDPARVVIMFGSQFIQVQKKPKMRRLMACLGTFLDSEIGGHSRRAYLVHPFDCDNSSPIEWGGKQFSRVKWGDTIPYDEKELVEAASRSCRSGVVRCRHIDRHAYFHQIYSLICMEK